jgi:hypothetical protein
MTRTMLRGAMQQDRADTGLLQCLQCLQRSIRVGGGGKIVAEVHESSCAADNLVDRTDEVADLSVLGAVLLSDRSSHVAQILQQRPVDAR